MNDGFDARPSSKRRRRTISICAGLLMAGASTQAACILNGDSRSSTESEAVGTAAEALTGTTNIKWVDTIASLRAWNAGANSVAILEGATGSEGIRGVFTWSTISATDDGSTVVNPTSGGTAAGWRRVSDGQLNVKWFGATGDGTTQDQAAIQAAVSAASAVPGGANIVFPPGTYRLSTAIQVNHDAITLTGGPGSVILVDPTNIALSGYPEGVLVNQGGGTVATHRVVIDGLTFQVKNGSDNTGGSAAVIQLNNCADCIVRNVRVFRDPSVTRLPAGVDGIVMAVGSTGGLIQGCTVDGIAKVGIYLPPNVTTSPNTSYTRIDSCEVKNMNGTIGATGFEVSSEHAIVSNCQSHDNLGSGLLIQTIGLSPPRAPSDIQILGGHYDGNQQHGIDVNTAYSAIPNNIQIANVSTSHNLQVGVVIENATNVLLSNPVSAYNHGAGMSIGSSGASRVQVVNPTVFDNGSTASNAGIVVFPTADTISIVGGHLYDDQATPTQLFGIELSPGGAPTNIRIQDVDCMGASNILQNAFVVTATNGSEAASGLYRIQHAGSPIAAGFAAPPGSEYVDTSAGAAWIKESGTSAAGWKQVVTQ